MNDRPGGFGEYGPPTASQSLYGPSIRGSLAGDWIFSTPSGRVDTLDVGGRAVLFGILAWLSTGVIGASVQELGELYSWLHRVHLVFHEAGHVLLMWAPRTVMMAGGTVGQLLMPLVLLAGFFFWRRDAFAAGVCLWWLAHSTLDCVPYIDDANKLELELLGGVTGKQVEGYHDWEYLLGEAMVLNKAGEIATNVLYVGRSLMILAFIWMGATVAWQAWQLFAPRPR